MKKTWLLASGMKMHRLMSVSYATKAGQTYSLHMHEVTDHSPLL